MVCKVYLKKNYLVSYVIQFAITCEFQQVNDPKRTSKAVKEWFGEEEIKGTT
jgi:hypothetical protein